MTADNCSLFLQQTETIDNQDTINFGDNIANLANPIAQELSVMPVSVPLFSHIHTYRIHYSDIIIGAMASQIIGVSIIYSTVCSGHIKENIKVPCDWPL